MEKQLQCPECHTWNNADSFLCPNCGASLHPFSGEWWKSYNMLPVRLTYLKRSFGGMFTYVLLLLISIYPVISGLSLALAVLLIEGIPDMLKVDYLSDEYWYIGICSIICTAFGVSLLFLLCKYVLWQRFAPNWLRRRRKELLGDDYIENYNRRKEHYVFIARGNGQEHKFGLFDVQKIKICIPMNFDELYWLEKGKLLKGVINGHPIIVDIHGNYYN